MVRRRIDNTVKDFENVPFEDIDLSKCSYQELKDIEKQLKRNLQSLQYEITIYEQDPNHDDEIGAYSEIEAVKIFEEAEALAYEDLIRS